MKESNAVDENRCKSEILASRADPMFALPGTRVTLPRYKSSVGRSFAQETRAKPVWVFWSSWVAKSSGEPFTVRSVL